MKEDLESFVAEIMIFLTEEDIMGLKDKAGVRFPLEGCTWSDLCYVCCWVGVQRPLSPALLNRMILGEQNSWTDLYVKINGKRVEPQEKMTLEDFFNLAG